MKPYVLCILDGVGMRKESHGNAVKQANMPNFDYLARTYPHSLLEASGISVGLPVGQMGNSEIGHTNIGAGRIVFESLARINKDIEENTLKDKKELNNLIKHVNKKNSKLHIAGLLSDGGIHSHINHLFSLIDIAKEKGIKKLYIHAFLDGRDTLPKVAEKYLELLDKKLKEANLGSIATISGRFYAMDRDNNYDRTKLAYQAMVEGSAQLFNSYKECIEYNYNNNITDEFVVPSIIDKEGLIEEADGILLFNYRPDRARQLFAALTNDKIEFERKKLKNIKLVTMCPVSDEVKCSYVYQKETIRNTFGEYIANNKLKQLRISETEKFAHVTYFFDGGKELDLINCDHLLIPSPKVKTYDLKPEMSAYEITNTLLDKINNYDVIILNFANGDMVGHTGDMTATIKALEVVDECLGKIYNKVKELDGVLFVCADHGNSDYMLDEYNNVITSHSTERVPFIITKQGFELSNGKLSNIAPTMLNIMNLKKPKEMTEDSLIK